MTEYGRLPAAIVGVGKADNPPGRSVWQFDVGAGVVPQQIPRLVIAEPPVDITFEPNTAVVLPIKVTVLAVAIGASSAAVCVAILPPSEI